MQFQLSILLPTAALAIATVIPRDSQLADVAAYSEVLNSYDHAACLGFDNISMNSGPLPPPTPGMRLFHIAIGRGTQNYSCSATAGPSAAPVANGALATLYNATCLTGLFGTDTTNKLTNFVAKQSRRIRVPSLFESGHHYFPDFSTPTFNLKTANADYGIDFSKKLNATAAPIDASTSEDGSAAVPWLILKVEQPVLPPYSLAAADTNAVMEIYRINTAGGKAPATCVNHVGSNFTQEYAAEYWFWSA